MAKSGISDLNQKISQSLICKFTLYIFFVVVVAGAFMPTFLHEALQWWSWKESTPFRPKIYYETFLDEVLLWFWWKFPTPFCHKYWLLHHTTFLHEALQWFLWKKSTPLRHKKSITVNCDEYFYKVILTICDTSFCDAILNIYGEMVLKICITTISKPHEKSWQDEVVSRILLPYKNLHNNHDNFCDEMVLISAVVLIKKI